MKNRYRLAIAILALFITGLLCSPTFAAVQASLSQNQIALGSPVQLILLHDGNSNSQPDLAPLRNDFDILGTNSGRSIRIVNFQKSEQVQVQVLLSPKHAGTLPIPALQWGNERSQALTLMVIDSTGSAANSGRSTPSTKTDAPVFLTSETNQAQTYVQSAVMLTVKIYTSQTIYQAGLDLPASSDVQVQALGKDQQGTETRNGRTYQVIQRQYLLTPQRSGTLTLEGPVLDAQVANGGDDNSIFGANSPFGGMDNSVSPVHLRGKAIVLDVRPRPTDASGHTLLPAQQLSLTETWQPDSGSVHAGDPITRHLHLSASGLSASQLPDLNTLMTLPDGIKAYPDKAKLDTRLQQGKVVGSADQDIALIASQPGHYPLPELRFSWWDSTQNIQREAVLPAHTLDVLPPTNGVTTPTNLPTTISTTATPLGGEKGGEKNTSGQNTSGSARVTPWPWISLALALLWVATLIAWWRERRRASSAPKEKPVAPSPVIKTARPSAALKTFHEACRNNQALAARQNLLAWARTTWPEHPPTGLNALAERLSDTQLTPLLQELDRACYTLSDWHGAALAQALKVGPSIKKTSAKKPTLGGLYS
jgi:hypothetical protein